MFPESKITEIYCMVDDFCKEFALQQKIHMIKDKKTKHRNKPNLVKFIYGRLKNIAQVEHSRHRTFDYFMVNLLSAIAVYCCFPEKPCINL